MKKNGEWVNLWGGEGVLFLKKANYFFHCKKCDNDWFIIKRRSREAPPFDIIQVYRGLEPSRGLLARFGVRFWKKRRRGFGIEAGLGYLCKGKVGGIGGNRGFNAN